MGSKDKWARAAVVMKGQAGLTYTHWKMRSSSNHNICRGQCSTCTFSGHLHAYIAQLQQRQETSRQSQVFKLAPKHPIPMQTHGAGVPGREWLGGREHSVRPQHWACHLPCARIQRLSVLILSSLKSSAFASGNSFSMRNDSVKVRVPAGPAAHSHTLCCLRPRI